MHSMSLIISSVKEIVEWNDGNIASVSKAMGHRFPEKMYVSDLWPADRSLCNPWDSLHCNTPIIWHMQDFVVAKLAKFNTPPLF